MKQNPIVFHIRDFPRMFNMRMCGSSKGKAGMPCFPNLFDQTSLKHSLALVLQKFPGLGNPGKEKTVTGLFRLDQGLHVLCCTYSTVTLCLDVSFANPMCRTEHGRPHCYPSKGSLTRLAPWLGTWVSGGFLAFTEWVKGSLCLFIQTTWFIPNTWPSFWESGILAHTKQSLPT